MTSRAPVQIVEIDVDFCTRTYGSAPCTAALGTTGARKCYNTFGTCQDTANFASSALTLRFGRNQGGLPSGQTIFPALQSVSTNPMRLSVMGVDETTGPLGRRERVTVVLSDFRYQDTLTDKYQSERLDGTAQNDEGGYNPLNRGTFFSKLKTRWPHYVGRPLRVKNGEVGDAIGSMRTKHYVIEDISGPDSAGNVSITAKDILALAEDEKAVCPAPSRGKLKRNIEADTTPTFSLIPSGVGSEYSTSGKASIGSEIVSFTRSGDLVTLTARGEAGTEPSTHSEGDTFQECYEISNALLSEAVADVLVNYGNIPSGYVDTTAWDLEASTWLPGLTVGTVIPRPTGVTKIVQELSELGCYVWWDAENQEIRFRLNRYVDVDDTIASITDDANTLEGSASVTDKPDQRLTRVILYHQPVNYAGSMEDPENFSVGEVAINTEAEQANSFGQERTKRLFSRWVEPSAARAAQTVAVRTLARYANIPRTVSLSVDYKDVADVSLASLIEVQTRLLQDETGFPLPAQVQVIEFHETGPGHQISVVAQVVAFRIKLGYIMDNSAADYGSASATEKRDGMYIAADATGFSDAPAYQVG